MAVGESTRPQLAIQVRSEVPFLPKVAFVLITLASIAGALFSGDGLGVTGAGLLIRWLGLWALALSLGFLSWRLFYLRESEPDLDRDAVRALANTAHKRARRIAWFLGPLVAVSATAPLAASYLDTQPTLRILMIAGTLLLAGLILSGVRDRRLAAAALVVAAGLVLGWAHADAGTGWPAAFRVLHLTAFGLWLGGALWNIGVAVPAGIHHPNVDAVLAGARQLGRFRWVVRFSLSTIVATGLLMAYVYVGVPGDWWLQLPGVLIVTKVGLIIGLVVVFITCPLFRQCSPVQGVCNVDDLGGDEAGEGPRGAGTKITSGPVQ